MKTRTSITYLPFALFAFACFAFSPEARAVCQFTQRRIGGAILLLPVSILLVGCPPWKISKILVNPQPLAGNETVVPVVMVAPSIRNVLIEVAFERKPEFTDAIAYYVGFNYGQGFHNFTRQLDSVPSSRSRSSAEILTCYCERADSDQGPWATLTVMIASDDYGADTLHGGGAPLKQTLRWTSK